MLNTRDEVTYSTVTISNCRALFQNMETVGKTYKWPSSGDYIEITYDNSVQKSGVADYDPSRKLQVGINSNSSSQIEFDSTLSYSAIKSLEKLRAGGLNKASALDVVDNLISIIDAQSVNLGAMENRLDSVLESITTTMDNYTYSLSTIRDADIAEVSSEYIRQQILQQASATLLSTANQAPSIALQLI